MVTNGTNHSTFIPIGSTLMIADIFFLEYKRTSQVLLNKYKTDCAFTSDITQSKILLFRLRADLLNILEILSPHMKKDEKAEAEFNKYQIEIIDQIKAI